LIYIICKCTLSIILVSNKLNTFIFIWIKTVVGLVSIINTAVSTDGAYLYAGMLIGISYGIMYGVEGWVNTIVKSYRSLTGKSIKK